MEIAEINIDFSDFMVTDIEPKEVTTYAVIEKENIPPAPVLWLHLLEEREQRRKLGYEFATLSELVLYFYSRNDERGIRLYDILFKIFLKKYDLMRNVHIKRINPNDAEYIRKIGLQIYQLEKEFLLRQELEIKQLVGA
jgi:hypothetical protein